jgi:hypothetical protein
MWNIKKKYCYDMGGFQWNNAQQGQNFQQGAGALGSFVTQLDNTEKPDPGAGVARGALTGASMGAAAGPIGMAAGAVIGGIVGGVSAGKKRREFEKAQADQRQLQERQFRDYSTSVLQTYPSRGVDISGYYAKYGGKIPSFLANSLAEGGEVVVADTPPETDQNGDLEPLASNVSKFHGDSHEAQSGGVGFNSTSDSYIFSDSLRTVDGLTYAKQAELIGKKKGKFESKLEAATDHASRNTAERMIYKLDQELSNLFNEQETLKANGKI